MKTSVTSQYRCALGFSSLIAMAAFSALAVPIATAPSTPMSDLTGASDSFQTNAMVDNVLIAYGANCDTRAISY